MMIAPGGPCHASCTEERKGKKEGERRDTRACRQKEREWIFSRQAVKERDERTTQGKGEKKKRERIRGVGIRSSCAGSYDAFN